MQEINKTFDSYASQQRKDPELKYLFYLMQFSYECIKTGIQKEKKWFGSG